MTSVINAGDILYIEVRKKECCIHLQDRDITVIKAISDFEKELEGCGFFRAHRSYLINIKKIRSFGSRCAELANGCVIDISPRRYQDLCREYLKLK